ncbi:DUF4167 domain-containing protein [Roseospirillum parvum]|uniref:DUF4167 domain-containing protein n=1 Tax=Roseospirillum parvum TaxID=83401 RepID=A0A1G7UUF0_9PROT|nr:DUF4167 domain-containing protein [Roseospirillum parvum]SDG51124.1 protein of unknown function [Roseospirillum parvum]
MTKSSNPKGRPRPRPQKGSKPASRNQTYDSNGPAGKIRGNAHQVMEKYLLLARDALSQGDRVLAENFFQHADHYFRLGHNSGQPTARPERRADGDGEPQGREREGERDQERGGEQPSADSRPPRRSRAENRARPPRPADEAEAPHQDIQNVAFLAMEPDDAEAPRKAESDEDDAPPRPRRRTTRSRKPAAETQKDDDGADAPSDPDRQAASA